MEVKRMEPTPMAERVTTALAPYLGPFNARIAVKTFAQRSLKLAPEDLKAEHVPALLDALRPTLYTLVGSAPTDALLERIRREVR
jgi:hypothetical protein